MLRAAAVSFSALAGALLLAMVFDAMFALPTGGLVVADVALLAVVVVAAVALGRSWRRTRFDARRLARLVEQRLGIEDSRLINAVAFSADTEATRGSEQLRQMAVADGEQAAGEASAAAIRDREGERRSLAVLAATVGVLVMVGLLSPRLYTMVLPRLVNPAGDHPPFTLLDFDVAADPEPVPHGYDATITAAIASPTEPPRRATLVFIEGDEQQRVPMIRTGDGRFALELDAVERSRRFHVATDDGRSRTHELRVLPTPTIKSASVTYRYPDYTGWGAESRPLSERGVRAIEGTRVEVEVRSNLPLDHGRWEVAGGKTITLSPDEAEPTVARGTFTIAEDGSYRLSLVGADGQASRQTLEGPIEAVADEAPFVQIIDPDLRLAAPPGWTVDVRGLARDDVAVDGMELRYAVNDGEESQQPMELDQRRGGRAAEGTYELPLSSVGAAVGDQVTGLVRAHDNHPDGPRVGESEAFVVRVVSDEQYREMARQQYRAEQIAAEMEQLRQQLETLEQQREQMIEELEALREQIEQQPDGPTAEQLARAAELQRQMREHAQQMEQLAEAMQQRAEQYDLYSFEPPYRDMLERMAEQMADDAATVRERAENVADATPEDLAAAAEALRSQREGATANRDRVELSENQVRQLAAAQRLQAAAQQIIAITEQQRQIADELEAFRRLGSLQGEERERSRELAERQTELRERLTAVVDRLERDAEQSLHLLPKMANTGKALAEEIRELKIEDDQRRAAELAEQVRAGDAWGYADSAARLLESLLSVCEGMCEGGSLAEIDNPLSLSQSQMGEAMSEMASASAGAGSAGQGQGQASGEGAGAGGASGTAAGGEGTAAGGGRLNGFTAAPPSGTATASTQAGRFDIDSSGFGEAGSAAALASEEPGRAERIEVDEPDQRRSAPPHAAGVPLQFREQTQQYFRRLAEDSR